ncbi:DUF998 domain-containing protein [Isoptericola jiangsuensis]|uniref:DUF998 domain-containing protein n=1 Tax=Isoptericola jiangsuensis TaxID=548579 RepID=UPI003AAD4910
MTPPSGVLTVEHRADRPAPGPAPGSTPGSPPRANTVIAGWGGGAAATTVGAAHVAGAGVVDPVADPVSFYAFVPGGALLVLVACLTLGLLGVVLVARGYTAGLLAGVVPVAAIGIFLVSMVLVGLFPTDPPGTASATTSAVVHRAGAATAFCVLPLVGLASTAGPRGRCETVEPLRRAGAALLSVVLVFLAIHLPLVALGSGIVAFGLLERVGLVLMTAYLALLAVQVDRAVSAGPPAGPAA